MNDFKTDFDHLLKNLDLFTQNVSGGKPGCGSGKCGTPDKGSNKVTKENNNMSGGRIAAAAIGILALVFGILAGIVWLLGSSNPYTPAGYVGYVTQGAVFGEKGFYDTQTGPSSPGRGWLLDVINVSITPFTYDEPFEGNTTVLSKDNLKIAFAVHVTWKIREDRVRLFVEKYAYGDSNNPDKLAQDAYAHVLREPLRSFARNAVQAVHSESLASAIPSIGHDLTLQMQEMTKDTPFEIVSVVVGNIQFPDQVSAAVAARMAASQLLQQKQTELDIAGKDAEIRVAQANGIAESMRIINGQLSTAYLQHEAIEAQRAMVGSPNHTTIYLPVGPMGVPLVGAMDMTPAAPTQGQ